MLIKFESTAASAPFVMLENDVKPLLRGMLQDNMQEGAVSGEHLADALAHLEQALAAAARRAAEREASDNESDEVDDDAELPVNLDARAAPLLDMLHKAKAEDGSVMWKPE
jgi:hypothetical protein